MELRRAGCERTGWLGGASSGAEGMGAGGAGALRALCAARRSAEGSGGKGGAAPRGGTRQSSPDFRSGVGGGGEVANHVPCLGMASGSREKISLPKDDR